MDIVACSSHHQGPALDTPKLRAATWRSVCQTASDGRAPRSLYLNCNSRSNKRRLALGDTFKIVRIVRKRAADDVRLL